MEKAILIAVYNTAQEHNNKLKEENRNLKREIKRELAKVYHALDNDLSDSAQASRKLIANLVRTKLCTIKNTTITFDDVTSVSAVAEDVDTRSNESKISTYNDILTGGGFN